MTNKELWEKVRIVSGSSGTKQSNPVPGITAELLNNHYASISTDKKYIQPTRKPDGNEFQNTVEEFEVFKMLDNIKSTSAGLDGIPFWYLRVAGPFVSKPIAHLFNHSISSSYLPKQWKSSIITPAPKSSHPGKCGFPTDLGHIDTQPNFGEDNHSPIPVSCSGAPGLQTPLSRSIRLLSHRIHHSCPDQSATQNISAIGKT